LPNVDTSADHGPAVTRRATIPLTVIAEVGAAFLCADLAIMSEPRADHASYIASWPEVLKNASAIFTAAAHAQHAADYLHGLQAAEVTRPPRKRPLPRPSTQWAVGRLPIRPTWNK
jgi:antirestriction protein ArdC